MITSPLQSTIRCSLTRFVTAAIPFVVLASSGVAAPQTPHRLPPKVVYIEVVTTDTTAMTITVQPKNSMSADAKTYKVTPAAKITVSGNPATLADLKSGLQVHFHLTAADSTAVDELSASPAPRGSE